MLFNSLEFVVFFPIITLIYFLIPHKYRWFHLLVASCAFYMAFIPVYILILFFTIIIDYYAGILIEDASPRRKKMLLSLSIIANVGVLAVFKYYNFFIDNMNDLLHTMGYSSSWAYLGIILPIGLSFHTFQAMSYTFEVYYGRQKAERHLGIYSLYVMYYPQLVAGPIERPQNILYQFKIPHFFESQRVTSGLILMMWGMLKKVVIADKLAFFADRLFESPEKYEGPSVFIGIVFFAFQIYCDFSGYSDIARGASRVMGIELMINFKQPYLSRSIHEFWQRWHISLSTWFRDYVYIPLGGNRKGKLIWIRNLMIVFIISGLWHGSSWNFVIWGLLHGLFTVGYLLFFANGKKGSNLAISSLGGMALTFGLVSLAWVFFRAKTFTEASAVLSQLTHGWGSLSSYSPAVIGLGYPIYTLLISLSLVIGLMLVEYFSRDESVEDIIIRQAWYKRYAIYYSAFILLYLLGVFKQSSFIYFQF